MAWVNYATSLERRVEIHGALTSIFPTFLIFAICCESISVLLLVMVFFSLSLFCFFFGGGGLRNKELGENRTLIPSHSPERCVLNKTTHIFTQNKSTPTLPYAIPLSSVLSLPSAPFQRAVTPHTTDGPWQPKICLADHLLGRNQGAGSTAPSPPQPLTACQLILLAFSQDKRVPWEDRLVCLTFKRV